MAFLYGATVLPEVVVDVEHVGEEAARRALLELQVALPVAVVGRRRQRRRLVRLVARTRADADAACGTGAAAAGAGTARRRRLHARPRHAQHPGQPVQEQRSHLVNKTPRGTRGKEKPKKRVEFHFTSLGGFSARSLSRRIRRASLSSLSNFALLVGAARR